MASPRREDSSGDVRDFALVGLITGLTIQTLEFVRELSLAVGYQGLWRAGIHVTNLRGRVINSNDALRSFPAFAADRYTLSRVVNPMNDDPSTQATALLKGLYRGLGIEG